MKIELKDLYWTYITFGLLCLGILTRSVLYFDTQNLWLDEASLAVALQSPWQDLIGRPLEWNQATPMGFLLISKLMAESFGYHELALRFLPFCASIALLFVVHKIGKLLFSPCTQSLLMAIPVGSTALAYYAVEFKQYGLEALFSAILLLAFLCQISFARFLLLSTVAMLFSYTSVFAIFGFGVGYLYINRMWILDFLKQNACWIVLFLAFVVLYYLLYIKPQAIPFFKEFFLRRGAFPPHNLLEFILWFWDKILPTCAKFALGGNKTIQVCYVLFTFLGFISLFRKHPGLGVALLGFFAIYWLFAFLRIYAVVISSQGVELRLALFWQPLFAVCLASGLACAGKMFDIFIKNIQTKHVLALLFLLYIAVNTAKINVLMLSGKFQKSNAKDLVSLIQKNATGNEILIMQPYLETLTKYYAHILNFQQHKYLLSQEWMGTVLPLINKTITQEPEKKIFVLLANNHQEHINEIKGAYPHALHIDTGYSLFVIDPKVVSLPNAN